MPAEIPTSLLYCLKENRAEAKTEGLNLWLDIVVKLMVFLKIVLPI